jgi:Cu/Ag efflux protein CusF
MRIVALGVSALFAFTALFAVSAAAQQTVEKPTKTITGKVRHSAIVESVDKETREIKLIGAGMRRFTLTAGPDVRNFDQIKPRDRLVVEYIERLRIDVEPAGTKRAEGAVTAVGRAEEGALPGAGAAETVQATFTVQAIDRENGTVTLLDSDGVPRTFVVDDTAALKLVDVGDEVTTRLTKAISISIEPPPPTTKS